MEKKRTYLKPYLRVIQLTSHTHLLIDSEKIKSKFIDDPDWDWDENGAQ